MKPEQRKYFIIGGVIIMLLVTGYWVLVTRNKGNKPETKEPLPTEMIIPTIDSSVKVSLEYAGNAKEVILAIKSIPSKTQTIDYELSYNTAGQGLQGVIGTINLDKKQADYEKEITLGTCSSGKCVYHQVVGKIKLSLKFNGDYGEKVFEKEYEI